MSSPGRLVLRYITCHSSLTFEWLAEISESKTRPELSSLANAKRTSSTFHSNLSRLHTLNRRSSEALLRIEIHRV